MATDKKKLFATAVKFERELEALQSQKTAIEEKQSAAVKAIFESTITKDKPKGSKGPFRYEGEVFQIRSRATYQTDAAGETVLDKDGEPVVLSERWYFANMGKAEIEEI